MLDPISSQIPVRISESHTSYMATQILGVWFQSYLCVDVLFVLVCACWRPEFSLAGIPQELSTLF